MVENLQPPEGENREATQVENQPNEASEAQPIRTNYQPIREAIERELEQLDRGSFRRILADYLGYAPTPKAIAKLAEKQPDRWIQGLTMLAQLAGYKRDSIEINNNTLIIQQMSDAELRKRLADAQQAQLTLSQTKTLATQLNQTEHVSRETSDHASRLSNLQSRPTSFDPPSRDTNVVDVVANVVDNPVNDDAANHVDDPGAEHADR